MIEKKDFVAHILSMLNSFSFVKNVLIGKNTQKVKSLVNNKCHLLHICFYAKHNCKVIELMLLMTKHHVSNRRSAIS